MDYEHWHSSLLVMAIGTEKIDDFLFSYNYSIRASTTLCSRHLLPKVTYMRAISFLRNLMAKASRNGATGTIMREVILSAKRMHKVNSDGRTGMSTKVGGSMTKKKALAFSRAKMELNMTANIQKINSMAKESTPGPTKTSTTENGTTVREQAKVFSLRMTAMFTMDSGGKIKRAVLVRSPVLPTTQHTKADGRKTKNMELESLPSVMGSSSRVIGKKTCQMGPASSILRMAWSAGCSRTKRNFRKRAKMVCLNVLEIRCLVQTSETAKLLSV